MSIYSYLAHSFMIRLKYFAKSIFQQWLVINVFASIKFLDTWKCQASFPNNDSDYDINFGTDDVCWI